MTNSTIGQRIKNTRQKLGVSQAELASRMGRPYQSIGQWERDVTCPRYNSLEEIADALGISVVELICDDDSDDTDDPQEAGSHPAPASEQPSPDFLQSLLYEIDRRVCDETEASDIETYRLWKSHFFPMIQELFDMAIQKLVSDAEVKHPESPVPKVRGSMEWANENIAILLDELITLASTSTESEAPLSLTADTFNKLAAIASNPDDDTKFKLDALVFLLNRRADLQKS